MKYSSRSVAAVLQARDSQDVETLCEALSDTDPSVRRLAADSLRRLGSPRAVDPLMRIARDSSDLLLRLVAINAVAAAGGGGRADELAEIAGPPNPLDVRVGAISALIDLGEPQARVLLAELVESDELTRKSGRIHFRRARLRWALTQLVELEAIDAIPSIKRALPHLDFRDRLRGRRAIRKLQSQRK
jgi:HEAT repeat protein